MHSVPHIHLNMLHFKVYLPSLFCSSPEKHLFQKLQTFITKILRRQVTSVYRLFQCRKGNVNFNITSCFSSCGLQWGLLQRTFKDRWESFLHGIIAPSGYVVTQLVCTTHQDVSRLSLWSFIKHEAPQYHKDQSLFSGGVLLPTCNLWCVVTDVCATRFGKFLLLFHGSSVG